MWPPSNEPTCSKIMSNNILASKSKYTLHTLHTKFSTTSLWLSATQFAKYKLSIIKRVPLCLPFYFQIYLSDRKLWQRVSNTMGAEFPLSQKAFARHTEEVRLLLQRMWTWICHKQRSHHSLWINACHRCEWKTKAKTETSRSIDRWQKVCNRHQTETHLCAARTSAENGKFNPRNATFFSIFEHFPHRLT